MLLVVVAYLWLVAPHMPFLQANGAPLLLSLHYSKISQLNSLAVDQRDAANTTFYAWNETAGTAAVGRYYIPLSLGTPPQTKFGVFDTGSGIIHVACPGCIETSKVSCQVDQYDISKSNSSARGQCASDCRVICGNSFGKPGYSCASDSACAASTCTCGGASQAQQTCSYSIVYGTATDQASVTGTIYSDIVTFPDNPSVPAATVVFGCDTKVTAGFFDVAVAPYFVGMSYDNSSLYSQLQSQGIIEDWLGFCLGDGGGVDGGHINSLSPGLLVLGKAQATNPMVAYHTRMVDPSRDAYWQAHANYLYPNSLWVELQGISIGNNATKNFVPSSANVAMLLDTGTPQIILPDAIWQALSPAVVQAVDDAGGVLQVQALKQQGYIGVQLRSLMSPAELDARFPTLYFELGPAGASVKVPLSPSRYMIAYGPSQTLFTILLDNWGANYTIYQHIGILGNAFMTRMFVQAQQHAKNITFGLVDTCDSLSFSGLSRRLRHRRHHHRKTKF